MAEVFDLSELPGSLYATRQVYNEFSFRRDSRRSAKLNVAGSLIEGYLGLSVGVSGDESKFIRTGFDIRKFIPILFDDRLIIPRLTFDMIENLDSDIPIPFSEYPRQHTFRGVSTKKIILSDNLSFVPSLEYQWPLSYMIAGHIFMDYALVARDAGDIDLGSGSSAIGFGIDVHGKRSEVARFEIAKSKYGYKFIISLGYPTHNNSRSSWE